MKWSDPDFRWSIDVSTVPAIEPVTPEDLRAHCRIDGNDEESTLQSYIKAARLMVEEDTQRALITQTLQLKMDSFPSDVIELRRCPVLAVSSIAYTDTDAASQTLAASNYVVDIGSKPGRVTLAYGESWPLTYSQANAVTVTFTAGYGTTPTSVDERARQAIRLLAGHWAINREAVIVGTISKEIELSYWSVIEKLRWHGYR